MTTEQDRGAGPLSRHGWLAAGYLAVLGAAAAARFTALDRLPGEIFGDIKIVHDYVATIRSGLRPLEFVASAGPLYHYLIAPLAPFAGMDYLGFKIASAAVSLLVLAAIAVFARRLGGDLLGLLAATVAALSSWLLIFSRLGNSQIAVPALTALAGWLTVRLAQGGTQLDAVLLGFVSSLGLYAYPPTFVLPAITAAVLLALRWTGHPLRWPLLAGFAGSALVTAVPIARFWSENLWELRHGYIGGKIEGSHPLATLATNVWHGLLAFHVRGDEILRNNPARRLPLLDPLSGALLLAGIVWWLLPARRRLAPAVLLPFLLLQVPSWMVLSSPREVPSASRTLGAASYAYLLVASGIVLAAEGARRLSRTRGAAVAGAVAAVLAGAISVWNLDRYFRVYSGSLQRSLPVTRLLARYEREISGDTTFYLVGCCWKDGMPEGADGLLIEARHPGRVVPLSPDILTCENFGRLRRPSVLVFDPAAVVAGPALRECPSPSVLHVDERGVAAFRAVVLGAGGGTDAESPLVEEEARLDGAPVLVRHPKAEAGTAKDLFDGDDRSALTSSARPFVVEITLPAARPLSSIAVRVGALRAVELTVQLSGDGDRRRTIGAEGFDRSGEVAFALRSPDDIPVRFLRLTLRELAAGPPERLRLCEVRLR